MSQKRARLQTLLLLLILAHILLAVQRLPGKVYRRRAEQLQDLREKGAASFFFGRNVEAAKTVQWLLDHTPTDCAVLFRLAHPNDWQGPLELANAVLQPRILYAEPRTPAGANSMHGRSFATGTLPSGNHGTLVLIAEGESLRLSLR